MVKNLLIVLVKAFLRTCRQKKCSGAGQIRTLLVGAGAVNIIPAPNMAVQKLF